MQGSSATPGLLLSLVCIWLALLSVSLTHAAEESSSTDLAAQVWQYLTTQDSEQANSALASIMQGPTRRFQAVQGILRRASPTAFSLSGCWRMNRSWFATGLSGESVHSQSYEPTKDYALVVCLHGAGFTGEAYLDRWKSRLSEQYILACPTYPAGAWFTRRAEDLVLATVQLVRERYRIDPNRIFLSGMSNGGIGAWLIGMHHAPCLQGSRRWPVASTMSYFRSWKISAPRRSTSFMALKTR